MAKQQDTGVYQLQNGNWAFRFKVVVNGDPVYKKCSKDEWGEPLKNKRAAIKARKQAIKAEKANEGQIASQTPTQIPVLSKTIAEVYAEYCEKGRKDRAFQTISQAGFTMGESFEGKVWRQENRQHHHRRSTGLFIRFVL